MNGELRIMNYKLYKINKRAPAASFTKEAHFPAHTLWSVTYDLKFIVHNLSFVTIALLLGCSQHLRAQTYTANPDLGNLNGNLKQKLAHPVTVNGGIALNTVYVDNTGAGVTNPQPFTWIATGNVNINLLGYALPFSFTYSNQKIQYTSPSFKFNRFSFNPRYKEWTAHIGDVSASFSPYTLSGYQYSGAGIEYNKGKWQAQALYGRFMRAVKEDSAVVPSYKRMGGGSKIVYSDKGKKIAFSIFHAKDDPNSIPPPVLSSNAAVTPMEGTAFAIEGAYPIVRNLVTDVEYSTSALTHNLLLNNDSGKTTASFLKKLSGGANSTTTIYHAINASMNYTLAQSMLGITYQRVDPGYQTLGGYFFTNDFENIAANISQNFWKGKMTASINTGLQRDDLNNTKESNMKRMLLMGSLNIRPSQKLNIGLNYSNMQSYTYLRNGFETINQVTPYQNLDTLNYTQLTQNAAMNVNYTLRQSKAQTQSISFMGNYMESANQQNGITPLGSLTRFFNGAANYTIGLPGKGLTVAAGFNYSYNYAAQISGTTLGPTLNVTKLFFKKVLRTNWGIAYNTSRSSGKDINVMNLRWGASASIVKRHNLNASIIWQNKTGNGITPTTYFTAMAGYAYSF